MPSMQPQTTNEARSSISRQQQRPTVQITKTSTTPRIVLDEKNNQGAFVERIQRPTATAFMSHPQPAATTPPIDLEKMTATRLVDQLLDHTKQIMTTTTTTIGGNNDNDKRSSTDETNQLHHHHHHHHHTIAFSGGVDSSLVAALVHRCSIDLNNHNNDDDSNKKNHHYHTVSCVMGISAAVPVEQVQMAEKIATQSIGISSFQTAPTNEGQDPMYIANTGQACLACKTELYRTLQAIAAAATTTYSSSSAAVATAHEDVDTRRNEQPPYSYSHYYLYNGTNADDLQDPTRLGLIAANNFHVRSPIAHITKSNVRLAAKHLGLPNWNTAASPCLRSRLALGVPATTQHLHRIAAAERFVQEHVIVPYNLPSSTNYRVRLLAQQQARLEIDTGYAMDVALATYQSNLQQWNTKFVIELGFSSITISPFKSGSVAVAVPAPAVSTPTDMHLRTASG